MLACGNYNGVVGFAKAKGPSVPVALQKVYLWPTSTTAGIKAGRIVQTILHLAGFKNVKSKVIGSRNSHNTVKAIFKALNAVSNFVSFCSFKLTIQNDYAVIVFDTNLLFFSN
ncbi:hypothetical protein PIB30_046614 [Stylosanthes scabra]|uniref:Small ribosomal subunit protein uS5 C-terminal domain-containing protein n=1 Tax=Stylosanthes scabra TaxID=79078 RepID=A0ABU6TGW9_9FABA|nr:hypothetical protein [Stylosanthes scabra]